ncbi:MAG: ABC transporter [Acidobacteria bacterium]|nr:MAG: ABC transporter [Acidobacteriota bacterium]
MPITPLVAMVRKDLQLFFSDRRAVIMSFAVPIAIASFFGAIFSGSSNRNTETAKIPVVIVDQDNSVISSGIMASAKADKTFALTTATAEIARDQVRRGKTTVGVIIPKGFGDAAGKAFFSGADKPQLELLYDPSHSMELAMVRGILTEHVMQTVSREMFTGSSGKKVVDDTLKDLDKTGMPPDQQKNLRDMLTSVQTFYTQQGRNTAIAGRVPGVTMPYGVREEAVTARANVAYNGYAHSFAGMGIQFLLFAAASLGIEVLLERQRGLWRRLRSAPVSKLTLLAGKTLSMTIVSLMTLLVSFGFAMVVFRVHIDGSVIGFFSVALACSLMAATFGLLIAALGQTPQAARGVSTFAVLLMVMLGGAWVPTFIFPAWLQQITVVVPARWAVDGLDAMTWRGIGLSGAVGPTVALLGFAALFGFIAVTRFRWEEV